MGESKNAGPKSGLVSRSSKAMSQERACPKNVVPKSGLVPRAWKCKRFNDIAGCRPVDLMCDMIVSIMGLKAIILIF